MKHLKFRRIPGYSNYGVSKEGVIVSVKRDIVLQQYLLNGYFIVDTFYDSLTETLPVHRAVALAWVENADPELNIVVNHIDDNRLNNWWENLEWVTHSENNYHAVNTGLRSDNIRCRVRDFETGEVSSLSSISQASEFMGLQRDTAIPRLLRKQFGSLINNRYEFRFEGDLTPWFYDNRLERIKPTRFMVVVRDLDGSIVQEVFSTRNMLKEFQLYDSPYGRSIPQLVRYANEKYSDKQFFVRDSYKEEKYRVRATVPKIPPIKIQAMKKHEMLEFSSLTHTAKYFNVDRKSITGRLDKNKELDGWIFTRMAS